MNPLKIQQVLKEYMYIGRCNIQQTGQSATLSNPNTTNLRPGEKKMIIQRQCAKKYFTNDYW